MASGMVTNNGKLWAELHRDVTGVIVKFDLDMLHNVINEMDGLDFAEYRALFDLYKVLSAERREVSSTKQTF